MLTTMQTMWQEDYTYDANSNRLTKTTAWGTIKYEYDSENRLIHSGEYASGTNFSYDANGNLLNKENAYKSEQYFYNSINRMAQSVVIDTIEKTHTSTQYGYDAFGRRNLVQDQGSSTMRTLYDGFSFDIVQEAEVFQGGDFTTSYMELGSIQYTQTQTGTSRYRYVGDDPKTVTLGDLTQESTRYTGSRATLYANGQAVATNRSASLYDNGRAYFGTDILGSVRSATDDYASLEDRYEYDIFGTPYEGDFTSGLNNGYTGKPYDTTTGLYNYGYRDYSPQQARFTTVDPIRDGNNWFSYVVNDPVNYVDLWGLCSTSSESAAKERGLSDIQSDIEELQDAFNTEFPYYDENDSNATQALEVLKEELTVLESEYNNMLIENGNLTIADYIQEGVLTSAFEVVQDLSSLSNYRASYHKGVDGVGGYAKTPFYTTLESVSNTNTNPIVLSVVGTDLKIRIVHGDEDSYRKTGGEYSPGEEIMPFPTKNNTPENSTNPHFHIETSINDNIVNPFTFEKSSKF